MAKYTMLQTGSSGAEVKRMQQALEDAGYHVGATGVDGIYGANTTAAVRQYQKDKGLAVDGIAGDETLGSLYGSGTAASVPAPAPVPGTEAVEKAESKVLSYRPETDGTYQQALEALRQAQQQLPVYADSYDRELEAVYSQIVGQKPFHYDVNGDALYRQYAQAYAGQGRLAMMDTMGQAAALTGGYGSSYSQSVGQQQYQAYLQQLNAVVPELYGMALDRYTAQGQALEDRYSMLEKQQAAEYGRYQDALRQYWQNVEQKAQAAQDAYDQGYNAWRLEQAAEETAYGRQQDAYKRLAELITGTGYMPTAAQLREAGMTQAQAEAYRDRFRMER